MAESRAGFPQPHVRLLPIIKLEVGGLTQWATGTESQIWHPDFAFHHAHLATNLKGEVGVSVGAGGGGSHAGRGLRRRRDAIHHRRE